MCANVLDVPGWGLWVLGSYSAAVAPAYEAQTTWDGGERVWGAANPWRDGVEIPYRCNAGRG